jgi:hypothetical protein
VLGVGVHGIHLLKGSLKEMTKMKTLSKKFYGALLCFVLLVLIVAMLDGWTTWFISSQRIHQIACLTAIREHLLESSVMVKHTDGSMTINMESTPLTSLFGIAFFNRHGYALTSVNSEAKPSNNRIVLVYNSDYLTPSVDWIALAIGTKVDLVLFSNGTISTSQHVDEYLEQSVVKTYYTYDRSE